MAVPQQVTGCRRPLSGSALKLSLLLSMEKFSLWLLASAELLDPRQHDRV